MALLKTKRPDDVELILAMHVVELPDTERLAGRQRTRSATMGRFEDRGLEATRAHIPLSEYSAPGRDVRQAGVCKGTTAAETSGDRGYLKVDRLTPALPRAIPATIAAAFEHFTHEYADQFAAIARSGRDPPSVEELHADSWLIAADIARKRGKPVDFQDPADQELLIRWLKAHQKFSRRGALRALSIDQTWIGTDGEEQSATWLSLLAAPESSDPLARLLETDEQIDWLKLARPSYSELSGYIVLFVRFEWDRKDLAASLSITVVTLHARVIIAADKARVQPSLFDGIDSVDPNFTAAPSFRSARFRWPFESSQLALF